MNTLFKTETVKLVHFSPGIMISIDTIPQQYLFAFTFVEISVPPGTDLQLFYTFLHISNLESPQYPALHP